jgi:hypothetical protein
MGKISILLLAALILAACFAPSISADTANYQEVCIGELGLPGMSGFSQAYTDYTNYFIIAALALVALAITLVYMYGKFRMDAKAEVWAKDEAYNLFLSIILFVAMLAFFVGSCDLSLAQNGANPIQASISYIDTLLSNNGLGILQQLTVGSIQNQLAALKYLYVGIAPFAGAGVATSAGQNALSAQKETLIDIYIPILASLNAQRYILLAITWMQASVLLPFAFILRLVPPTREYGNMFIAMLFGIYIIAPAAYVMCSNAFNSVITSTTMSDMMNSPGASGYNFYDYSLDTQGETYSSTVLYQMGSTIPQAVFLPNLILIITISCTMAVWKAIRAVAA